MKVCCILVIISFVVSCSSQERIYHHDIVMTYDSHIKVDGMSYDAGKLHVFGQVVSMPPCGIVRIFIEEDSLHRTGKAWADGKQVLDYVERMSR